MSTLCRKKDTSLPDVMRKCAEQQAAVLKSKIENTPPPRHQSTHNQLIILAISCRALTAAVLFFLFFATGLTVSAQDAGIHTNALYWLTATPNVGVDVRLGQKYSLSLDLGYNAINFPNYTGVDGRAANPKFHHWLVMPEAKRWFSGTFRGHYIGLHLFGGKYNVGGLKFSKSLKDARYDGWIAGAGLSYGYQWRIGSHWGLEASLGVGYAYLEYKKYECGACGRLQYKKKQHYFGPTKAALSVVYYFGGGSGKTAGTRPAPVADRVVERDTVRIIEHDTVQIVERRLAEARKSGRADATLYLNFPLDSSVILPDYKDNAEELHKAEILLRDADVRHITITGYASPEGEYEHNRLLSAARAEAVGRWVASVYGIPSSLISTSGLGEDWEGLRRAVEKDPAVPCRDQVLEIIDNTGIFSGREKRLMDLRYGRPYNYMLKHLFPWLRRMEMTIEYNNPATEADEK